MNEFRTPLTFDIQSRRPLAGAERSRTSRRFSLKTVLAVEVVITNAVITTTLRKLLCVQLISRIEFVHLGILKFHKLGCLTYFIAIILVFIVKRNDHKTEWSCVRRRQLWRILMFSKMFSLLLNCSLKQPNLTMPMLIENQSEGLEKTIENLFMFKLWIWS